MAKESNTEEKILSAAEEIFHQKGFDGARMQEIAAHAGINKGLLHYYFKTKDKLFEAIFNMALNRMISKITTVFEMDISLEQKISHIVDQYMTLLVRNPDLPRFVVNELNKNADKFIVRHFNKETRNAFQGFVDSVEAEIKKNNIKKIDARQLFMNLMSLMIFPFVGRPLMQSVMGIEKNAFKEMMVERKIHIIQFMMDALRK